MAKILVVDDEPAIRQMLVFTLESDGHTCEEAGDGYCEALLESDCS